MAAASLEETLSLPPGTLIAKKYRVEKLLAAGGMGAVLRAHHEALDQPVAIKVMRPELADRREAAQRFMREARAAAKIASDYVARVTDVDTLPDDTPFMVMEYLDGRDLDALLEEHKRLPIAQAVDFAIQALAGVEAAHALGVVHRDLKPSNLFLVERPGAPPRIKILDFGISKVVDDTADRGLKAGATTSAGAMLGTPRYMSPEQVASAKSVDARTDIWAMGLILYEMLTGSYPFTGDNSGEILAAILNAPPAPLRELRPDAPPELDDAVARALAKRRDERFSSAREMMKALAPFASKRVQALVIELEHAPPSTHLDGAAAARTPDGTLRSAAPDALPATARAPTPGGSATAVTRVEPAMAPSAAPREPDAMAATKLSSMRPAQTPSPPTDTNMTVGRAASPGGRWAMPAVIAAVALAAVGGLWLMKSGPPATSETAANATAPSAESATASASAAVVVPVVAVDEASRAAAEPSADVPEVAPSAASATTAPPEPPSVPRAPARGAPPPSTAVPSKKGLLETRD